jgi:hypothetical protein
MIYCIGSRCRRVAVLVTGEHLEKTAGKLVNPVVSILYIRISINLACQMSLSTSRALNNPANPISKSINIYSVISTSLNRIKFQKIVQ